jgi:DNA-binding transcriptional LysR family regulator
MQEVSDETALTSTLASIAPKLALLRALNEDANLTRAAAEVGIPQPTASRWLAALSAELGTPVVVADGRGVRLTRSGAYVAGASARAMSELSAGVRQAQDEADPDHGRVAVAFLHTLGQRRVPDQLRAFRGEHPRVRFTLLQGAHDELLDHVRHGRADLAFTAPLPGPGEFDEVALETQYLVLTVPADHRLAGRRHVRMAELEHEQFVGMKQGYGLRTIVDDLATDSGFVPTLAFEGEEVDTVRGLVAAGLGVAVLPPADPAPPPEIVEIPLRPRAGRRIGLVWVAGRPLAPVAATFRDFVSRRLGRVS